MLTQMTQIHCDGCGGQFVPGQIHYFANRWREDGVRWLCARCHPDHPADVCEDRTDRRTGIGATLVVGDLAPVVVDVPTRQEAPHRPIPEPTPKRRRGWPKGVKRQGKGGPAVRE